MKKSNDAPDVKHETNITGKPHRWKPGESGNPDGRPRTGKAMSELLRGLVVGTRDGRAIAKKIVAEAKGGNMTAIGIILDRLEGRCPQIIETPGGGAANVLAMCLEMDRLTAPSDPRMIEAARIESEKQSPITEGKKP